jgi:hypothetical protein
MNEMDVKKELYKSKAVAKLSHYVSGNLYYTVELEDGTYRFPIATVEDNEDDVYKSFKLSSDLGTTSFFAEMKGSELNRWIAMAIKSGDFIKIS